jgi:ATP-binding cassette subfamily C protein CydC
MALQDIIAAESRRQRGRLLAAGACAALVGAAAVLLLGISGWFITAAALAGLAGPAAAAGFNYMLPSAAIRLLAIARTGGRYAERLAGHEAALRALAAIRPALFAAIAAMPPGRALALAAGEASARLVQDVDAVEARFIHRSARWGLLGAAATGCLLLLLAGPWPALATALVLAGSLFLAHRLSLGLQARGQAIPRAAGRLKGEFAALAAAAPELRAFGLENWAAERIARRGQALSDAQARSTFGAGWFDLLQAVAVGLAAMAALSLAAVDQPLPLAALAALGAAMTVDGAGGFARGLERRGALAESERRLEEVLAAGTPPAAARAVIAFPPAIALAQPAALLPPGTIAALTGASGSGKTRLLETLLALRPAAPGAIGLGGADLTGLHPATARRCFAHAPQDAQLLAGTVRDNLCLADPQAGEAALWSALGDAALEGRIRDLPQGLDSWLGENGARLSGGERRRLVLARALLRPAPWLLLDEPTEGLDAATEALLLQRLAARLAARGQGALIVTHRPAVLQICGTVLRMEARAEGMAALG